MQWVQRFSRAGPRGRGREWATQGVHPLSWLLSNNRLEEVCSTLTKGTFSSRLLLSNQDKGCTPSVAHSLPLPLGPALLNLSNVTMEQGCHVSRQRIWIWQICSELTEGVWVLLMLFNKAGRCHNPDEEELKRVLLGALFLELELWVSSFHKYLKNVQIFRV